MGRRWLWTALAGALGACVAGAPADPGQSGSEELPPVDPLPRPSPPSIGNRAHCPCDLLDTMPAYRATVAAIEGLPGERVSHVELRAEEHLSPETIAPAAIGEGEHFGGSFEGRLPCGGEFAPAEGDQVLAFFRPGDQDGAGCCAYLACTEGCPSEADLEQADDPALFEEFDRCMTACQTETAADCGERAAESRLNGRVVLLPWGESLLLGQSEFGRAALPRADLPYLYDPLCDARLPNGYDAIYPALAPGEPGGGCAPESADGTGSSLACQGEAVAPPMPPPEAPSSEGTPAAEPNPDSGGLPPPPDDPPPNEEPTRAPPPASAPPMEPTDPARARCGLGD